MDVLVEPPPSVGAFISEAGGLHYLWRGQGMGERATTVGVYNTQNEQWTLLPTTGHPPPGLYNGSCTIAKNHLYCFGGKGGSSRFNDLFRLNLDSFEWSKVHPRNDPSEWPICKTRCGLLAVDDRKLVCFGGFGLGSEHIQPGATFTNLFDGRGYTNEFHVFDIIEGTCTATFCVYMLYITVTIILPHANFI